MKIFIILFILYGFLDAKNIAVAKKNISFKDFLTTENIDIAHIDTKDIPRTCVPFEVEKLNTHQYTASKYIRSGSIICEKDASLYESKEVLFNFGSIEIKTDGEIVNENDDFITIKKHDGSIHRIFKDGRER
ncbi:hypothetical protein [Arcobacter sp. FWKO B]|uniref:hypothetical protein n=1 Tax=Arcobacter sp. FWKO B TaxID=2593672 RepID=UPI0018A45399|nr:hypothetical protein [Arcobacter sp. FWKO B]QOG12010.1 hypothetical protein FWKOB_04510 [Arcobacter sp. FWKO B]